MSSVSSALLAARGALTSSRWVRRDPLNKDELDATSAVLDACGGDAVLVSQVVLAIEDALFDLGLEGVSLPTFNDHYATDLDDLLAVFDAAISRAREAAADAD